MLLLKFLAGLGSRFVACMAVLMTNRRKIVGSYPVILMQLLLLGLYFMTGHLGIAFVPLKTVSRTSGRKMASNTIDKSYSEPFPSSKAAAEDVSTG